MPALPSTLGTANRETYDVKLGLSLARRHLVVGRTPRARCHDTWVHGCPWMRTSGGLNSPTIGRAGDASSPPSCLHSWGVKLLRGDRRSIYGSASPIVDVSPPSPDFKTGRGGPNNTSVECRRPTYALPAHTRFNTSHALISTIVGTFSNHVGT